MLVIYTKSKKTDMQENRGDRHYLPGHSYYDNENHYQLSILNLKTGLYTCAENPVRKLRNKYIRKTSY